MFEREGSLVWFLVVFVLLIVFFPMLMMGTMGMMGMIGYGSGFLVLLILIGIGVYMILSHPTNYDRSTSKSGNRALDILKERYARGEITREEYLKIEEEIGSVRAK